MKNVYGPDGKPIQVESGGLIQRDKNNVFYIQTFYPGTLFLLSSGKKRISINQILDTSHGVLLFDDKEYKIIEDNDVHSAVPQSMKDGIPTLGQLINHHENKDHTVNFQDILGSIGHRVSIQEGTSVLSLVEILSDSTLKAPLFRSRIGAHSFIQGVYPDISHSDNTIMYGIQNSNFGEGSIKLGRQPIRDVVFPNRSIILHLKKKEKDWSKVFQYSPKVLAGRKNLNQKFLKKFKPWSDFIPIYNKDTNTLIARDSFVSGIDTINSHNFLVAPYGMVYVPTKLIAGNQVLLRFENCNIMEYAGIVVHKNATANFKNTYLGTRFQIFLEENSTCNLTNTYGTHTGLSLSKNSKVSLSYVYHYGCYGNFDANTNYSLKNATLIAVDMKNLFNKKGKLNEKVLQDTNYPGVSIVKGKKSKSKGVGLYIKNKDLLDQRIITSIDELRYNNKILIDLYRKVCGSNIHIEPEIAL